jgi:Ca2+/H+ antiporter, TMEM165/GDT1 family
MHSFLVSAGVVAVSEIGDKTQLLALLLATRFRRPVPIILGILVATALNHTIAAFAGVWLASAVGEQILRWLLGLTFIAMAVWALIPDKIEDEEAGRLAARGAFVASAIGFFLAEIGDKTQIATAALAARYETVLPVVLGTTLGMLAADVPAVIFGHVAAERVNARWVRFLAALLFAALGLATILSG